MHCGVGRRAQLQPRMQLHVAALRTLERWRRGISSFNAALIATCATLLLCLLCQKERPPEVVPLGGRNRPRLPWLRGRPARRAVLTSTQAAVVGATCTHVATGPKLAVDHRGFLCFLEQLQPESGCCGTAHLGRFNCDGCELQTEGGVCCLEFERCVSCCIGASGTDVSATVELALTLEGCVGRCRTASKSLDGKVWNRYRSERKYCNGSGGEGVDGDGDP